ncbi:MAG: hypothetical protein HY711_03490, partial [Candidatus Melainabacteria bacterium]|nr:hypothetical protein [Candidatus Melainabacteria bacterium]
MPFKSNLNDYPVPELLVGPYRAGKTTATLTEIVDYACANPFDGVLVVVPSARAQHLIEGKLKALVGQQLNVDAQRKGVFGIKVVSFGQLCQMVLRAAGVPVRLLSDELREAVVACVMQEKKNQLATLGPIVNMEGTAPSVLALIDRFARGGLSPTLLKVKLEKTASVGSRYMELANIYQYYWHKLDSIGYLDERRLAFSAREILCNGNLKGLKPGWVVVDGFDRISHLQAEIILGLSRYATKTRVIFDYLPEWLLRHDTSGEYDWKQLSFQELTSVLSPTISYIEPKLHSDPKRNLFGSLDRFAEMDEIVRRCKKSIVEDGIHPDDLLVVVRDLKLYRAAVEAAFGQAGIPYFIDESVSLLELPIVRFVLGLTKLALKDFPRGDVIACLRSPYCRLARLGLGRAIVDYLDNLSWNFKIVSGKTYWERLFGSKVSCQVREAFEHFLSVVTPHSTNQTFSQFACWLEDILDELLDLGNKNGQTPALNDPGINAGVSVERDEREAMGALRDVIARLVERQEVLGTEVVGYESFVHELECLMERTNFRRTRPDYDVVTICGAELAPNRCYEEVFVAGLVEGEFPKRTREGGFISREQIARWVKLGFAIEDPRHHPGFEQALLLSLVARAKLCVHMSFPYYEMDGSELTPSFFLTKCSRSTDSLFVGPFSSAVNHPVSGRDAIGGWRWFFPGLDPPDNMLRCQDIRRLHDETSALAAVAMGRICGLRESLYNGNLAELVKAGVIKVLLPEFWSVATLNE